MNVILREDAKPKTGKNYLYLDITDSGKRKKVRLNMYTYIKPKNTLERNHNAKVMALASQKEAEYKLDAYSDMHSLDRVTGGKLTVIEYFEKFKRGYKKSDFKKVEYALVHYKAFSKNKDMSFRDINENYCNDFADYLVSIGLSGETCRGYFNKFRMMLKRAYADKLTRFNVKAFELEHGFKVDKKAINKPIMTDEEIELLSSAKWMNDDVRRAYFTSLYTGIDFKTCKSLTWGMVDNGRLVFERSKTGTQNYMPLSDKAIEMLGKPDNGKQFIFRLGTWEGCVKVVRRAATSVGITKKITWHSARHTFATRLHAKGVDIRTLQVLLGHSDISHTMKYTKVSDENRRKAVDLL